MKKSTMKPSVTVLLLCWNHERYLEQCIGALAAQTSRDFNIIFLDNVSSDGSAALAARLLAKSGISHGILTNDRPQTISTNLNRMLKESNGSLVSFLSTDDWLAPRYVEAMTQTARKHPAIGWFSCGGWFVDKLTGALEPREKSSFEGREDIIAELIAGNEPFFFAGHCYRRSLLVEIGGWDDDQLIEDADLFFRLAQQTRHLIVDEKLFYYRKHHGSASLNPTFMVKGMDKFFEKHCMAFPDRARNNRSIFYRHSAARYADLDQGWSSIRTAWRAVRIRPFVAINWRTLLYGLRVFLRRGEA